MNALQNAKNDNEILTGLLFVDPHAHDLHSILQTSEQPLNQLTQDQICPGEAVLEDINAGLR
jgi:2-oxoglutarate ferredoxin oxidoreductase subunit beta